MLPADTLFYAEITDLSETIRALERLDGEVADFAGQGREFPDDADARRILEATREIRSLHLAVLDFQSPDLASLQERDVGVEEWRPSMVLLADLGPEAMFAEFFEREWLPEIREWVGNGGYSIERGELQGQVLYEFRSPADPPVFALFFDTYLAVSLRMDVLDALLAGSLQGSASLDTDDQFLNASVYRPQQGAFAYLNLDLVWREIDDLIEQVGRSRDRNLRKSDVQWAARMLLEFGARDLHGLAVGLDFTPQAVQLKAHVQVDETNVILRALRQSSRNLYPLLDQIPSGAIHATLLSLDDPARTWKEITTLLVRAERLGDGPGPGARGIAQLGSLFRRQGADLETDVLGAIGNIGAFVIWGPQVGGRRETPGLLLQRRDRSKADAALATLVAIARDDGARVRSERHGRYEITWLGPLAYASWDEYILYSSSRIIKELLDALERGRTLGADTSISRLVSVLPSQTAVASFVDLTEGEGARRAYMATTQVWEGDGLATRVVFMRDQLAARARH
jgi:hypothetical protein